jgi:hypothetical protein
MRTEGASKALTPLSTYVSLDLEMGRGPICKVEAYFPYFLLNTGQAFCLDPIRFNLVYYVNAVIL